MTFHRTWMITALMSIVFTFAWSVDGHTYLVPEKIPGVTVVNARELKTLLETSASASNSESKVVLVDVRRRLEFVEEHLPGAISIPYKEGSEKSIHFDSRKDSFDLESLKRLKAGILVFYCNGLECWRSYKASLAAQKARVKSKIFWFRDGIPSWKEMNFLTAAGTE